MRNRVFLQKFSYSRLLILLLPGFSPVFADSHLKRGGTLIFGRGGDSVGLDSCALEDRWRILQSLQQYLRHARSI